MILTSRGASKTRYRSQRLRSTIQMCMGKTFESNLIFNEYTVVVAAQENLSGSELAGLKILSCSYLPSLKYELGNLD